MLDEEEPDNLLLNTWTRTAGMPSLDTFLDFAREHARRARRTPIPWRSSVPGCRWNAEPFARPTAASSPADPEKGLDLRLRRGASARARQISLGKR